jgi:hypothetical protein
MAGKFDRNNLNYAATWKRDKGVCQYCGDFGDCIDHIIPFSYSQDNSLENLVVACDWCNTHASDFCFTDFTTKREFLQSQKFAINKKKNELVKRLEEEDLATYREMYFQYQAVERAIVWCFLYGRVQLLSRVDDKPETVPESPTERAYKKKDRHRPRRWDYI